MSKHKLSLLLTCALAYLYFRGIGDHGLLDPLEGVNASVSLNMVARGDAVHPIMGEQMFTGATLGFWWLNALSLLTFGWSEFAVRFWSVCGALGMAAAAAATVRPFGDRAAYYATLVSGTTLMSFFASQVSSAHTLYAAFTSLALAGFVRGADDRKFRFVAHTAAALAFMVYGPAGILLPWFCLFLYSWLIDDPNALKKILLDPIGLGFSAFIGLGYLLFVSLKNPSLLSLMRYAPLSTSPLPWYLVLGVGLFPWAGYFISAVSSACPRSGEDLLNPEGPRTLLLVWVGVFAFFGAASGDGMALTACVPALAALSALHMDDLTALGAVDRIQKATALNLLLFVLFLTAGTPLLFRAYPILSSTLLSILPWGLFSLLFLFAGWHYAKTRQPVKLWRHLGLVSLLSLLPMAGAFDLLAETASIRPAGMFLRNKLNKGDILVQYGENHPSFFFYTARDSVYVNADPLPDVPGQKPVNDTALHLIWKDKARVYLLINRERQLRVPLPSEVNDVFDNERILLLSNWRGEPTTK